MKTRSWILAATLMLQPLLTKDVIANTELIKYDASSSDPVSQGWSSFLTGSGSGSLINDQAADAWQANGVNGLAQWKFEPSTNNNNDATNNGWTMSWTSRVVSGNYVTDYYSNGTSRFIPILAINNNGDLTATLLGGGTHTLVTGSGANDYNTYQITFNALTQTAEFSFNGNVIESNWGGQSSSQNMIVWGNGSSSTDGVAYYRNVSFQIHEQATSTPTLAGSWDTSNDTFDGSVGYVDLSNELSSVANLASGAIYSKFAARGTTGTLFSVSDSADGSSEYALVVNGDGTLKLHARENGSFVNETASPDSYNNNVVTKTAFVVDNTGTRVFVDGELVLTDPSTNFVDAVSGADTMAIGRNFDNSGGQWYFNGDIFETQVYASSLTDVQAVNLTRPDHVVASFNSAYQTSPVAFNWVDDSADLGTGRLVTDLGASAWQADGAGGRAEWEVTPSVQVNSDAATSGWKMTTVSRIVSGSAITDYYGNGATRFLVSLSLGSNGELIAAVEGGSTHTLLNENGSADYHTYEIEYDPASMTAAFSFDGSVIETWSGSSSSQNVIVWGNGSSSTAGVANYRSVKFETLGSGPEIEESTVFAGGEEGINGMSNYRIPSMIEAPDGSILAFIEGRPSSADPGQAGQINISLKRSLDKGQTWLPVQVLEANSAYDYSDPRPLVDASTGTVYVFYTQWEDLCAQNGDCVEPGDPNYLIYRKSTDNGVTWSAAVNVSAQTKDPTWRSINAGPGHGIQLAWQTTAQGEHNGRLIFPSIIRAGNSLFYVSSTYSDDNGTTWQSGALTPISGPTEADMVELVDGRLLLTARNDGGAAGTRYHFLSSDGGETWVQTSHDIAVSKVDIGMTRYSAIRSGDSENRIIVTAPIGQPAGTNRNHLGIWSSFDEGVSFGTPHQLVYGFSAYSDVITLSDGSVGIIYEATGSTLVKFIRLTSLDF